MPTKKSASKPASPDNPDLRFEDAVERLEDIIGRMESERIPLDDLLRDYEEGTRLLKLCRERIEGARARVEKINRDLAASSGGDPDPDAGLEEARARVEDRPPETGEDEDEITLL